MSTPNANVITFLPNNQVEIELLFVYGDQTQPQYRHVANIRDILNIWRDDYHDSHHIAIRHDSFPISFFEKDNDDIYLRLLNGLYQDLGEEYQSHPIFIIRHRAYSILKEFGLGSAIKLENNHRTLVTNEVENTDIGNIMS